MFGSQLCTGLQQTLVALLAGIEIQVIFYSFGGMDGGELCPEYACLLGGQIYIIYASLCQYFAVAFKRQVKSKSFRLVKKNLFLSSTNPSLIIEQSESPYSGTPVSLHVCGASMCGLRQSGRSCKSWPSLECLRGQGRRRRPVELTVVGLVVKTLVHPG